MRRVGLGWRDALEKRDFDGIVEELGLEIVEATAAHVVVHNPTTNRHYRLTPHAISECEAGELSECLAGKREPLKLITITRVIGYYSQTANWNKSKLGELEARRKGRYEL